MSKKIAMGDPMAGRPELGTKGTRVHLYPEQVERIDALTGAPKKRSEFIREAIDAELKRRENP